MIKTTLAHKSGRSPGVRSQNLAGHPGSRNVIKGAPSKTGGRADGFIHHKRGCGHIHGSPGTEIMD